MLGLRGVNVGTLVDCSRWTGGGVCSTSGGGDDMTMGVDVLKAKNGPSLSTDVVEESDGPKGEKGEALGFKDPLLFLAGIA